VRGERCEHGMDGAVRNIECRAVHGIEPRAMTRNRVSGSYGQYLNQNEELRHRTRAKPNIR
jgi:hypothetical protein